MENLKEKLKINTKWKSELIIFYSLIGDIPRIFLNKLWTHFVDDFQHFFFPACDQSVISEKFFSDRLLIIGC